MSGLTLKNCFTNLIELSWPLIVGNLGMTLIGAVNILIASKHSIDTLSAISIANAIVFCILIVGVGLISSISIVLSNLRGQRQKTQKYLYSSLTFAVILATIFSIITLLTIPLIPYFGFEAKLVPMIKEYMYIVSFSFFGMYIYNALKEFLQSYEIVFFPNFILLASVVIDLGLNIILVFGFGNFKGFGVAGLALATLFIRTFIGLAMIFYCRKIFRKNPFSIQIPFIAQLVKIGYPIGFALLLEFLGFNIITVLMGKIEGVLASVHNIITLIISLSYMVPLAISNALAIKVGFYNGACNLSAIKKYALTGALISCLFMMFYAIILLLFPKNIMQIFSSDNHIVNLGASILLVACVFEIVDGLQVTFGGILKGIKQTKVASICAITGYWFVGIPLGAILCYHFNMLLKGFWIGLASALFIVCFVQFYFVLKNFKKLSNGDFS